MGANTMVNAHPRARVPAHRHTPGRRAAATTTHSARTRVADTGSSRVVSAVLVEDGGAAMSPAMSPVMAMVCGVWRVCGVCVVAAGGGYVRRPGAVVGAPKGAVWTGQRPHARAVCGGYNCPEFNTTKSGDCFRGGWGAGRCVCVALGRRYHTARRRVVAGVLVCCAHTTTIAHFLTFHFLVRVST